MSNMWSKDFDDDRAFFEFMKTMTSKTSSFTNEKAVPFKEESIPTKKSSPPSHNIFAFKKPSSSSGGIFSISDDMDKFLSSIFLFALFTFVCFKAFDQDQAFKVIRSYIFIHVMTYAARKFTTFILWLMRELLIPLLGCILLCALFAKVISMFYPPSMSFNENTVGLADVLGEVDMFIERVDVMWNAVWDLI